MAKWRTMLTPFILAVVTATLCVSIVEARLPQGYQGAPKSAPISINGQHEAGFTPNEPIKLCDCHTAERKMGTPEVGLTCTKDGFFIAGFMEAGYPEGNTEELLPLSPAICCRPCVPDALENGEKVQGVITMNCEEATGNSGASCAGNEKMFLTGFNDAALAFENPERTAEAYYPYGRAQCCTPTLLLQSGDLRSLQRCNCGPPKSPSRLTCAAQANATQAQEEGRLITGFKHAHNFNGKFPVPTSPAECCDVCLGPPGSPQPAEDCSDINHCNHHGYCYWGQCQCFEGWSGEACQVPPPGSGRSGLSDPNSWALSLVVISGCMLGCCSKLLVCSCDRANRRAAAAANQGNQDMEEPLMGMQRNDDTSAEEWSTDTEEEDDDDDDENEPPQPAAAAEPAAAGAELAEEEGEEEGDEEEEMVACPIGQGEEAELQDCSGDPDPALAARSAPAPPEGPGLNLECVVCMSAQVQVVSVPCGHACMCRKCSRRLRRCPLCRQAVTRRQKLFLTS